MAAISSSSDPDVARRAGAAIAALGALKTQAGVIPGLLCVGLVVHAVDFSRTNRKTVRRSKVKTMSVSIIIPTWNEAANIATTIRELRTQRPHEIIVVDGGSSDATVSLRSEADRVLLSEPGRAFQMNAGAAAARGDLLLFLHADCRLEAGAIRAVERVLARPAIVAGCFSMRVEADGWGFRSIDACATARVRWTGVAYGDQGLFLRRDDFRPTGRLSATTFHGGRVFLSALVAGAGD